MAFGTDYTPVGPMPADIVLGDVDATSMRLARDIRDKGHGIDTRETMARMILKSSTMQNHLIKVNNALKVQNDEYYRQFTDVLKELSEDKDYHSLPEIAGARRGYDSLIESLQNLSVSMLNKNLGKLDGSFFTDEFIDALNSGTTEVTRLLDGTVTPQKTTFMDKSTVGTKRENISNEFTFEGNIDVNTGVLNANSSYATTDYINLEGVRSIFRYVNDGSSPALYTDFQVGFYDSSNSFISSMYRRTEYEIETQEGLYGVFYDFPPEAKKIRLTMGKNNLPGGTSSPYTYILTRDVYNYKIKNEFIEIDTSPQFPLTEKTVVNLGDSIFGNNTGENSVSNFIAQRTGASVINVGFGGTRGSRHGSADFDAFSFYNLADEIVKNQSDDTKWKKQDDVITRLTTVGIVGMPPYYEQRLSELKTINFNQVDYLTIAFGTNDFTGLIPLDNDNPFATYYFGGALRYGLEKIMTKFPNLKILICTPTYRFWWEGGQIVEDSDTRLYSNQSLVDFVDKCIEVAKEFKIPYVDNYRELGINKYNRTLYFSGTDGTHPNAEGNKKLGHKIGSALVTKF